MLRNKTLRERIHSIDESVKNKAASISEETQHFFSLLGIKATIKEFEEDNDSLEIKLQFSEGTDHFVSLFYDVETDDYDCKYLFLLDSYLLDLLKNNYII